MAVESQGPSFRFLIQHHHHHHLLLLLLHHQTALSFTQKTKKKAYHFNTVSNPATPRLNHPFFSNKKRRGKIGARGRKERRDTAAGRRTWRRFSLDWQVLLHIAQNLPQVSACLLSVCLLYVAYSLIVLSMFRMFSCSVSYLSLRFCIGVYVTRKRNTHRQGHLSEEFRYRRRLLSTYTTIHIQPTVISPLANHGHVLLTSGSDVLLCSKN